MSPSKSNRRARTAMPVQSTDVAILGVDVGGTFTDAVLVEEGTIRTAKVPTAPRQEESVLAAARAVGAGAADPERFAHGTTVATNALLERRGAPRPPRAARALPRRPRPDRSRGRARAARPRLAARPRQRGGGCRLPALRVPRPVARGGRRGGAAPPPSRHLRRRLTRARARVPGVRARLDDCCRRLPRARRGPLPSGARRGGGRGGPA